MNGTRLARNASAAAVAGIAAWSSWSHMVHVALRYGERAEVAYVLPLSVDGMLVVATVAMADDKRCGRTVRLSARVAFLAGVVASVAANIAAAQPSVGARIVAGWPALALLLVVEILSRSGRSQSLEPVAAAATEQPPAPAETPQPVLPDDMPAKRPAKKAPSAEKVARAHAKNPDATHDEIAKKTGVSVRTVARHRPAKTLTEATA